MVMISLLGLLTLLIGHGMALIYRIAAWSLAVVPPIRGRESPEPSVSAPFGIILTGLASFLMSPAWGFHGWERLSALADMIKSQFPGCFTTFLERFSNTKYPQRCCRFYCQCTSDCQCYLNNIGNLTFFAIGKMPISSLGTNIIPHWWLGNAMGVMAIAPTALLVITPYLQSQKFLLSAEPLNSSFVSPIFPRMRRFLLEFSTIILFCVVIATITVAETNQNGFRFQQLSFLSFVPVIWAATALVSPVGC